MAFLLPAVLFGPKRRTARSFARVASCIEGNYGRYFEVGDFPVVRILFQGLRPKEIISQKPQKRCLTDVGSAVLV